MIEGCLSDGSPALAYFRCERQAEFALSERGAGPAFNETKALANPSVSSLATKASNIEAPKKSDIANLSKLEQKVGRAAERNAAKPQAAANWARLESIVTEWLEMVQMQSPLHLVLFQEDLNARPKL